MFASAGNENKRKQVDKRITITANIINQEFLPSIVASLLSRLACEQRWLPGQQFLLFANVMLVASHLPRVPSRICDFIFRGCFWHGSFCNIAWNYSLLSEIRFRGRERLLHSISSLFRVQLTTKTLDTCTKIWKSKWEKYSHNQVPKLSFSLLHFQTNFDSWNSFDSTNFQSFVGFHIDKTQL